MEGTSTQTTVIETQHQDIIHDTQFDYYGQWVASASSDGTVKIFSAKDKSVLATLIGHEGPVWMVAWAHPRFGSVIASASFDKRVIVWKEGTDKQWRPVHIISCHTGSVNSVAWAPQEYGALLASAASDGSVAVCRCVDGAWGEATSLVSDRQPGVAHALGSTSVSFAPYHPSWADKVLLASGGCDGKVRLWSNSEPNSKLQLNATLSFHSDWVRDVAVNPDGSSPFVIIASCGQDKTVVIARRLRAEIFAAEGSWEKSTTVFPEPVWRLSWSPCGTMLLVTTGDSEVYVLKEGKVFTDSWIRQPLNDQQ